MGHGTVPRQHHIIPAAYLARFERGNKLQILDLRKQKVFSNQSKKVLRARDFYTATAPDGEQSHFVETELLQAIESKAGPIIEKMIRDGDPPCHADWEKLALFIALMEVRTVSLRQAFWEQEHYFNTMVADSVLAREESFEEICRREESGAPEEWVCERVQGGRLQRGLSFDGPQRTFLRHVKGLAGEQPLTYAKAVEIHRCSGYAPTIPKNQFLSHMLNMLPLIAEYVEQMNPRLLFARGRTRFITSDQPITRHNPRYDHDPVMGHTGWLCAGVEVFLPVSPYCCLMMTHDGDQEPIQLNDQMVGYLNVMQGMSCFRYVAADALDFGWLRRDRAMCWDAVAYMQAVNERKPLYAIQIRGPIECPPAVFDFNHLRK